MKCPHCSHDVRGTVFETRKHDGRVYRRRECGHCGKWFVTQEEAPVGLRMPAAVDAAKHARKKAIRQGDRYGATRS